jgi:hypothetical protein
MTHMLTTIELAEQTRGTPASIRAELCRKGHYLGLTPERLPNGRLLWPADSMEQLLEAGRKTAPRTPPGPKSRKGN